MFGLMVTLIYYSIKIYLFKDRHEIIYRFGFMLDLNELIEQNQ
jgi:hypothetical protein